MGSASETVTTSNITTANVTLADPTLGSPAAPTIQGVMPTDQGVIIAYGAPTTTSNGNIEADTSYTVQWTTDPTFATGLSSETFAATGPNSGGVWILDNQTSGINGSFTNGTQYYFRARGTLGANQSSWVVYGSPKAVTIGQPSGSGYNTVTGTIYIPSTVTINSGAQLFVGYYSQGSGIYAARVASPVNTAGGNAFTVYVPNGSYQFFGILDQNNDGIIDAGDVTNTNDLTATVTISGSLSGQTLTLPSVNSATRVSTEYNQNTFSGGSSTSYNLSLQVREQNKLPVAATMTLGSNVFYPVDISSACEGCGTPQFTYYANISSVTPVIGQEYDFLVTYKDGSQETIKGYITQWGTTGAVVGPTALATNLSPAVTSSSTQPTFSWTYPSGASTAGYLYQFYLQDNNGNQIWQIPSNNSNSKGFAYSNIPGASITWNVDPTNAGNTATVTHLTSGSTYNWSIQIQDSNQNEATTQTYFVP
jgi:hypothetical protein